MRAGWLKIVLAVATAFGCGRVTEVDDGPGGTYQDSGTAGEAGAAGEGGSAGNAGGSGGGGEPSGGSSEPDDSGQTADSGIEALQIDGVWVFQYTSIWYGQGLFHGTAEIVDDCLVVVNVINDIYVVIWEESRLADARALISAVQAGEKPEVQIGGGELQIPATVLEHCPAATAVAVPRSRFRHYHKPDAAFFELLCGINGARSGHLESAGASGALVPGVRFSIFSILEPRPVPSPERLSRRQHDVDRLADQRPLERSVFFYRFSFCRGPLTVAHFSGPSDANYRDEKTWIFPPSTTVKISPPNSQSLAKAP